MPDAYNSEQVDRLVELGWKRSLAQVYCTLVRKGSMTARKLHNELGISRSKAYDHLGDLAQNDKVEIVEQSPKKYSPLSPDEVLNKQVENYEESANEAKKLFGEAQEVSKEERPSEVSILRNIDAMDISITEKVRSAEDSIIGFEMRNKSLSANLVEAINEKSSECEVEILIRGDYKAQLERFKENVQKAVMSSKSAFLEKSTFYVLDDKSVVVGLNESEVESDEDTAVRIQDEYIATVFRKEFEQNLTNNAKEVSV